MLRLAVAAATALAVVGTYPGEPVHSSGTSAPLEGDGACLLQATSAGSDAIGGPDGPNVYRPISKAAKVKDFPRHGKKFALCPESMKPPELVDWRVYEEKGHWMQIGGVNVYTVGQVRATKSGVILAHDVYGMLPTVSHIRAIADEIASYGHFVMVPDYFKGGSIYPFYQIPSEQGGKDFLRSFPFDQIHRQTKAVISYMKHERGVKYIGMAGYCWGAWVIARMSEFRDSIQAAVWAHPTLEACEFFGEGPDCAVKIAQKVQVPTLIMPSFEEELYYSNGTMSGAIRDNGFPSMVLNFSDQFHGFMTRGSSFGVFGNDFGMSIGGKVQPKIEADSPRRVLPTDPCAENAAVRGIEAHITWFGKFLTRFAPQSPRDVTPYFEEDRCPPGLAPATPGIKREGNSAIN